MSDIHSLASVDPGAIIGDNVKISPFAVIEEGAVLGNNCEVGPQAYITKWARIGDDVKIHKGAVVGSDPQDLKFEGEDSYLEIGDRTTIREFTTLNRGTKESGRSSIGSDCLIMAYVHVAHDCHIGNRCILVNGVQLGGHIEIGDWAIIGGLVPIHQFVRIGKHAMVGGGWRVPVDVPPFTTVAGDPLSFKGLNSLGLRRRNFEKATIATMKRAYKIIFQSDLNISQALERVRDEIDPIPEVIDIIDFIESRGDRGLVK